MPEPTCQMTAVTHRFGAVEAIRDLSFEVPHGRITVLLGPNGAGKTTAIRLMTGALTPTSGLVRTFGTDPTVERNGARERIGVVAAKPALYERLTGWENLAYAAALWQIGGDTKARSAEVAAIFGIDEALGQLVGGYSTGMKTRLALARAVLADPELLLLDEPTSGLDPESARAVLALIRRMTAEGRTVVMCTHLLSEAEGLADQIVVMDAGTAAITGTTRELTAALWPRPVVEICGSAADQLLRLAHAHGVVSVTPVHPGPNDGAAVPGDERWAIADTGTVRVELDDIGRVPSLVASLVADGVQIYAVRPLAPNLEELYFAVRRQRHDTEPDLGSMARDVRPDSRLATAAAQS